MIEEVISNDYDISETFNIFSVNIIPNLKIITFNNMKVQNAINKFQNYPSIKMIISKINPTKIISFCSVPHNAVISNDYDISETYPYIWKL